MSGTLVLTGVFRRLFASRWACDLSGTGGTVPWPNHAAVPALERKNGTNLYKEGFIVGGPEWMETDKFDIVTQPDAPGAPNEEQGRSMMRKLLSSRFGLKYHNEKKELSAYILTAAKDGPKLTKSDADPIIPHAFFFTKFGNLTVRNATMDDFASGMQGAVFDRPVVNHTSLDGRWNCSLKRTPDETQFQVFGVKIVPSDAPDAPPAVFTAIQEQIGLKLDAVKTLVDVMILDHVEKPSEN
jgi:uncharacterized protein (TIGR03435 family)